MAASVSALLGCGLDLSWLIVLALALGGAAVAAGRRSERLRSERVGVGVVDPLELDAPTAECALRLGIGQLVERLNAPRTALGLPALGFDARPNAVVEVAPLPPLTPSAAMHWRPAHHPHLPDPPLGFVWIVAGGTPALALADAWCTDTAVIELWAPGANGPRATGRSLWRGRLSGPPGVGADPGRGA